MTTMGPTDITYSAAVVQTVEGGSEVSQSVRGGREGGRKRLSRPRPLRHVCQNDNREIRRGGASEKSDSAFKIDTGVGHLARFL